MLTAVYCHSDDRKKQHAENESEEEFFQYVPVEFPDHGEAK
jgi:hypothetical protein